MSNVRYGDEAEEDEEARTPAALMARCAAIRTVLEGPASMMCTVNRVTREK